MAAARPDALVKLGRRGAGVDATQVDAVAFEFQLHRSGRGVERRLGRRVRAVVGQAAARHEARTDQDVPAAGTFHDPRGGAHGAQRAEVIDLPEQTFDDGLFAVHGVEPAEAGVGEYGVGVAEFFAGVAHHRFNLGLVGDVGGRHPRFAPSIAYFAGDLLELAPSPRREHHVHAGTSGLDAGCSARSPSACLASPVRRQSVDRSSRYGGPS